MQLFLQRRKGKETEVLATRTLPADASLTVKIQGDGGRYSFLYATGGGWQMLAENADGTILSTDVAGGFVGATVGPFARLE